MRLLLDTHALLWFQAGDRRLSKGARGAIEGRDAERFISAASIWEMAIKASLGDLELPRSVQDYVAERTARGYRVLPVSAAHAASVEHLPFHHRDPFDRLLIAQALIERLPVVTRDPVFAKYGVSTVW